MFFLIAGGAASGKTTVARELPALAPGLACHDADELPASDAAQRWRNLEEWVRRALAAQEQGSDFLLAGHSPLGELLACPSAPRLAGIAACLLDCADHVRVERIRARGVDPRWPPGQHTLNWASWHRMHARDPQWEPHVIAHACPYPELLARWSAWRSGDPRWRVEILDTTAWASAETLRGVAAWAEAARSAPPALAPAARWWE